MAKSTLIPLALLYTKRRAGIEGATRFQKLVFLAQKESGIPDKYAYHADNYGPYSPQLHSDLQELDDLGLIRMEPRTNEVGNTKHVYSITTEGISKIKRAMSSSDGIRALFNEIQQIKDEYNEQNLSDLLRYVYQKYPTYATESELDLDKLFDPDARSQFLEPSKDDFAGTAPGEWKEVNSSAEDIFSI